MSMLRPPDRSQSMHGPTQTVTLNTESEARLVGALASRLAQLAERADSFAQRIPLKERTRLDVMPLEQSAFAAQEFLKELHLFGAKGASRE